VLHPHHCTFKVLVHDFGAFLNQSLHADALLSTGGLAECVENLIKPFNMTLGLLKMF